MGGGADGLWVELEWLLGLPLEGPALTVLWSAVREELEAARTSSPQTQSQTPEMLQRLDRALARQELDNLRASCLDGDWSDGLRQLERQLGPGGGGQEPQAEAVTLAFELVVELHHRLLDDDAPPWELDADERAELLWRGHRLLDLLEPMAGPRPPRLPVVREQLTRYGALAWMERSTPEAPSRAIALLLALAEENREAHPWILQGLRERIPDAADQDLAQLHRSHRDPAAARALPCAP